MISEEDRKNFEKITKKLQKELGWEAKCYCPNCKGELRDDAFTVIHFLGGIDEWWCPNCTAKTGEMSGHRVGCWNTKGTFPLDFYKILDAHEQ